MNKYLTYRIEDYLTDEDFINSVSDLSHQERWAKWSKDNPESAKVYYEALDLINALKFKEDQFINKDSVWDRIERHTEAQTTELRSARRSPRYLWITGAVAAGLAFILVTFMQYYSSNNDASPSLVSEEMILPADSKVSGITGDISYDPENWDTERRVQLDGSATFEVTQGVPFIVETALGSVRVLGTKFSVSTEDDSFVVDVEHGKVSVTSGSNSQVLVANMSYRKNALVSSTVKASNIIFHQYEDAALKDIIKALESSYNVKISMENEADMDQTYTGFFDSVNLKTALQSVFWPMGMTYDIEGDQIMIKSE